MISVGVRELKARLSSYIGIARGGEEVVVTARGREVAILFRSRRNAWPSSGFRKAGRPGCPRGNRRAREA